MRSNALDVAKLAACFFIIVVHVGNFTEYSNDTAGIIRTTSRWALPFFFMVYGYTLGLSVDFNISKRINKLIAILFYASLLYIPLHLYYNHWNYTKVIDKYMNINIFHGDAYFHLWFINALILGVMLTNYFICNHKKIYGVCVSVALVFFCWFFDVMKYIGANSFYFYMFRFLLGFSLVFIGYQLSKSKSLNFLSVRSSAIGLSVSILLIIVECLMLKYFYGKSFIDRQTPLFSMIAPVFIISLCMKLNIKDNLLSFAGRELSLGVYLVHPLAIYFISQYVELDSSKMLFSAFVTSIIFMLLLKFGSPFFFKKLNAVDVK
ncbi:acyltransferase family protein [Providencia rettgeri]